MPLTRKTVRVPEPHPSREQEQEEEEQRAKRTRLEPVEAQPMGPRPYRDFVEREARDYWQSLGGVRSLTKPTQEEIRMAAMPILCAALRGRTGWSPLTMAHHAVGGMIQHALETGRIKSPFSEAGESPNYVEALIKLADDANWLAREIPLPDHPPPHHPPIYYTVDPETNRPVPRADGLIRGDYVFQKCGSRLTSISHIRPWLSMRFKPSDFLMSTTSYYSLVLTPENNVEVMLHWPIYLPSSNRVLVLDFPIRHIHFSPQPPSIPGRSRE